MQTMRHFVLLLILVVLATSTLARAGEIFLSPSGDDGASGAKEKPLKTLSAALSKAGKGDTITLAPGKYAGGVTVRVEGVTIRGSDPKDLPRIECGTEQNASTPYACIGVNAPGVALRHLEIVGGKMHAVDFQAPRGVIEDSRVHDSGWDCVKCSPSSSDIVIRRCEIYNSGVYLKTNAEGIDNVASDRMLVQDCFIHDIATNGAYAKGGAAACVIERCLFVRCGIGSTSVYGLGVILGESANPSIIKNPGKYENVDGIVRNCVFVDIEAAGIGVWCALRPKVYNNTLVNVARKDRAGLIVLANRGVPTKDATIVNNIIVVDPASDRAAVWIYEKGHAGKLTIDHNRYFAKSGKFIMEWKHLNDLTAWRKATGADAASTFGDPKLEANHHLAAGSPCVDAGQAVEGLTDDFDGGERQGKIDIGADELDAGEPMNIPPEKETIGTGAKPPAK